MDLSLKTESWSQDDQSWLGSEHGTTMGRPITLAIAAFDEATYYPDGWIKSGTGLAVFTSGANTGLWGPYVTGTATDGSATLVGFLLAGVPAPRNATANVGGALFDHGRVVAAKLPHVIDSAGWADVAGRIWAV